MTEEGSQRGKKNLPVTMENRGWGPKSLLCKMGTFRWQTDEKRNISPWATALGGGPEGLCDGVRTLRGAVLGRTSFRASLFRDWLWRLQSYSRFSAPEWSQGRRLFVPC